MPSTLVEYSEAVAVINAAPNTADGIRTIRPFVDAVQGRATFPVRLRLNRFEIAALTAVREA